VIQTIDLINAWLDNDHVPKIEGWCTPLKGCHLANLTFKLKPKVAVEIGVFAGKSLLPIALALKEIGFGKVIAIDPWSSKESQKGYSQEDYEWWGKIDHEDIFRKFNQLIERFELRGHVEVWRTTSDLATPPEFVDLLHIDGQHTEQAIRDVARYASKVRRGGMVVMDDIHNGEFGVKVSEAVDNLLGMGFKTFFELHVGSDDFAIYEKSLLL
jgi:predicted O-methyltransferase YrrM